MGQAPASSAVGAREQDRPALIADDILAAFIQSTPDFAIFVLDRDGVVASWNSGAQRVKGYAAEEVIGKHFSAFYTAADVAARRPQYVLQRAMQDGRFEDEGWRLRKDGTMFWANVVVTAIRAPDGELHGFVKVTRDLTPRRHAEEALRRSEERYRLLVESVKDYAIYGLDATGHITSWNEGARRLKGYTVDEVIGRHFSMFYTKEDRDRQHPEEELQLARAQGRYEEEGWRVKKGGSLFWAQVTITALSDADGRHVGFVKVTRDLTERKRAEEEIRARARSYEEINRELDAFSHTVAHDLRSPIRAVEHLSSVLLEEEGARLSQDGRQTLEALHTSSIQMARLVQDLLDLSTAAGREPVRRDVDLTELAREVSAEASRNEGKRDIAFDIQPGLRANADPHLMRVALSNLVTNAIKFTRAQPRPRIEIGEISTPHGTAFFVRDNGIGFAPEQASRLFRPFSRLVSAHEFEGTGIGLATVARVVKRHGGKIWAEAHPGEGATFYFTFPRVIP